MVTNKLCLKYQLIDTLNMLCTVKMLFTKKIYARNHHIVPDPMYTKDRKPAPFHLNEKSQLYICCTYRNIQSNVV